MGYMQLKRVSLITNLEYDGNCPIVTDVLVNCLTNAYENIAKLNIDI